MIVTPFEVVKIKLQQQRGMRKEDMRYTVRCSSAAVRQAISLAGACI